MLEANKIDSVQSSNKHFFRFIFCGLCCCSKKKRDEVRVMPAGNSSRPLAVNSVFNRSMDKGQLQIDKTVDVVRLIRLQQRVRIIEKLMFSSDQRALTKLNKVFFIDPDTSGDSSSSSEDELEKKRSDEKSRVLKKAEGFGLRSSLDVKIWDSLWSKRLRRAVMTNDDDIMPTESNLLHQDDHFEQKVYPKPRLTM